MGDGRGVGRRASEWGAQSRLEGASGSRYGTPTARLRPRPAAVGPAMEFRVLGTIEVAGPSPERLAARREGARDPRAAAARSRPHGARGRAARGGLGRGAARGRGALARGARGQPARVPRARPRPRRAVLAAGPRRARLPARGRARAGRRPALRALRAHRRRLPAAAALELLDGALALWRGTPFGELADAEFARAEVRRLEELRSQAEEARARALVELGRPLEAVGELRRLGRRRPAAGGARAHADARALRRRSPGRGARPPTAS